MIYRPLIHVFGPPGSGKTMLIERLLEREVALATCIRGERDAKLRRREESAPEGHPELRRYREAGASGVALYRFSANDREAFYDSKVMTDYSEAVLIEGDCPVEHVDLSIFVARAPRRGESLLRRVARRSTTSTKRTSIDLTRPEELGGFMPMVALDLLERSLRGSSKASTRRWALTEAYAGLERAQLLVVNLRPEDDARLAEELCAEIHRLRKDPAVFSDVIGMAGNRVPITAVVANLEDPKDAGLGKCANRVKRTLRSVSG